MKQNSSDRQGLTIHLLSEFYNHLKETNSLDAFIYGFSFIVHGLRYMYAHITNKSQENTVVTTIKIHVSLTHLP